MCLFIRPSLPDKCQLLLNFKSPLCNPVLKKTKQRLHVVDKTSDFNMTDHCSAWSFPTLNYMFIIETMTTKVPQPQSTNFNTKHNVSLTLTKLFLCLKDGDGLKTQMCAVALLLWVPKQEESISLEISFNTMLISMLIKW